VKHAIAFVWLIILIGAGVAPVYGHWADLAVAEITAEGASVVMTLVLPTRFVARADTDGDGSLAVDEVMAHGAELSVDLGRRIVLTGDGERGHLAIEPAESRTVAQANATPATHSTLRLVYSWQRPIRALTIRYDLFVPGISSASCLATILQGGTVRSVVFTPEQREVSLIVGGLSRWSDARGFTVLGIEHILSGYDHILFLVSLLVVGGSLARVLKTVTAFTVAHSLTLSLGVLGLVQLPGRWVESAIALSIVYVAAENLWRANVRGRDRWAVTFGFGLVHGLGFAGILTEMALPRATLAVSLASFNFGVELGQVAVVLAVFGFLQLIRTLPREQALRRWASAGAMSTGLVWFIQRTFLG
jgi:hydrogenase/urease accessory protein HupE